jgi:hypothetical protein
MDSDFGMRIRQLRASHVYSILEQINMAKHNQAKSFDAPWTENISPSETAN